MYKSNNNTGFTLAEVLITLAVIGIVAAISIPALQSNTSDAELKSAWKKAYASISQAVLMMDSNNDNVSPWNADPTDSSWSGNAGLMRSAFGNYLKYTINSGSAYKGDENVSLFAHTKCKGDPSANCFNQWNNPYSSPGAALADGMTMQFNTNGGLLDVDTASCTGTFGGLSDICGYIVIDVNGKRSPNLLGTDVFGLWVRKRAGARAYISPMGVNNFQDGTDCTNSNLFADNAGCSAYALLDIDY